jgi:hypothetical protein
MRLSTMAGRYGGVPGAGGGSDPFPDIPAPSGSATLVARWSPEPGADGYLVYLDDEAQPYGEPALYAWRYKAPGQSTNQLSIPGIQAGSNYRYRVAYYVGSQIGELSAESDPTTAS